MAKTPEEMETILKELEGKTPEEMKTILKELEAKHKELEEKKKSQYSEHHKLRAARDEKKELLTKLEENETKITSLNAKIQTKVKKLEMPLPSTRALKMGDLPPPPPPPPPAPPPQTKAVGKATAGGLEEITTGAIKLKKTQIAPKVELKDQVLKDIKLKLKGKKGVELRKTQIAPKSESAQPKPSTALHETFKKGMEGMALQKLTPEQKKEILKKEEIESLKKEFVNLKKQNNALETVLKEQEKRTEKIRVEITGLSTRLDPNKYTENPKLYQQEQERLITHLESNIKEFDTLEIQRSEVIAQKRQAEEDLKQETIFEEPELKGAEFAASPPPPPPPPVVTAKKDSPLKTKKVDVTPKAITKPGLEISAKDLAKAIKPVAPREGIINILTNKIHINYQDIIAALGEKRAPELEQAIIAKVEEIRSKEKENISPNPTPQATLKAAMADRRGGMKPKKPAHEVPKAPPSNPELTRKEVGEAIGVFYDNLSDEEKATMVAAYNKIQQSKQESANATEEKKVGVEKSIAKVTLEVETPIVREEPREGPKTFVETVLEEERKKIEKEQKEANILTEQAKKHLTDLRERGQVVVKKTAEPKPVQPSVVVMTPPSPAAVMTPPSQNEEHKPTEQTEAPSETLAPIIVTKPSESVQPPQSPVEVKPETRKRATTEDFSISLPSPQSSPPNKSEEGLKSESKREWEENALPIFNPPKTQQSSVDVVIPEKSPVPEVEKETEKKGFVSSRSISVPEKAPPEPKPLVSPKPGFLKNLWSKIVNFFSKLLGKPEKKTAIPPVKVKPTISQEEDQILVSKASPKAMRILGISKEKKDVERKEGPPFTPGLVAQQDRDRAKKPLLAQHREVSTPPKPSDKNTPSK